MRKVYNVKALLREEIRDEVIVAESEGEALEKVANEGMEVIELSLDPNATFALWTSPRLDEREMAQFYFTLGQRVGAGNELTSAVREAAEFTRNIAVKVVLTTVASAVERGQNIDIAMRDAGLPQRDWSLIRALRDAGRLPDAFRGLGRDYQRRGRLTRQLKSLVYEPAGFGVVIFALVYLGIVFLAPRIQSFFSKLSTLKLPPLAQHVYAFTDAFNHHLIFGTILYMAAGVGFIVFVKSPVFGLLLDRVPAFKELSQRADHAALWSVFSMLYASAAPRDEAARLTAETANRPDNRDNFMYMASRLLAGRSLDQAILESSFPEWVTKSVANAFNAGGAEGVVESLQLFTDNLASDVEMLTERLSVLVRSSVTAIMGLALMGLALMTVVPMVQSALSAA